MGWYDGIFRGLPEVVDGHVTLSDAPGWGVEIEEGFLKTALQTSSTF
jgi:L-alanine-DL-glutamate epimerase-like enolase superfamily enzyme